MEYQCIQKCYPIFRPSPPASPPVRFKPPPTSPPILVPPVIATIPTKLPHVVPLSSCQVVCYRYPYSAECSRCKLPQVKPIPKPALKILEQKSPISPKLIPAPPPPPLPSPVIVQPAPVVMYNQMRCCYMDKCYIFPIQPTCPTICYEPCNAICTGRCLLNPTCPNKCVEVGVRLREYKIKFMIWLKMKLDQIKLRHRQMLEECILRTRANYVTEIRALQAELIKSHPYLYAEQSSTPMRRGAGKGIYINILGQQNFGGRGAPKGAAGSGEASSYHVNQNIGINNNDSPNSENSESGETSTINPTTGAPGG